jgi:phosphoribosylamine--glycine ligase
VLNVTAMGATVSAAKDSAYAALDKVDWDNGFCRRDIGWQAVEREKA